MSLQDQAAPGRLAPVRADPAFAFNFGSLIRGSRAAHYLVTAEPHAPPPEIRPSGPQLGAALSTFLQQHSPDSVADVADPAPPAAPQAEAAVADPPVPVSPIPRSATPPAAEAEAAPAAEPAAAAGTAEPPAPQPSADEAAAPPAAAEEPAAADSVEPAAEASAAAGPEGAAAGDEPAPTANDGDLTSVLMNALMSAIVPPDGAAAAAAPAPAAEAPASADPAPPPADPPAPAPAPAPAPSGEAAAPAEAAEDTLDPTFLAALPSELRSEVLRRLRVGCGGGRTGDGDAGRFGAAGTLAVCWGGGGGCTRSAPPCVAQVSGLSLSAPDGGKPFFSGLDTLPQGGGGACLPFWKFWVPSVESPPPPPRWG